MITSLNKHTKLSFFFGTSYEVKLVTRLAGDVSDGRR